MKYLNKKLKYNFVTLAKLYNLLKYKSAIINYSLYFINYNYYTKATTSYFLSLGHATICLLEIVIQHNFKCLSKAIFLNISSNFIKKKQKK